MIQSWDVWEQSACGWGVVDVERVGAEDAQPPDNVLKDEDKRERIKGERWKIKEKMPKIDTLDALDEHEEHDDDYQTNSNW